MPITLNHSNIGIQYNTGSNYIIETVKSDLYRRNEIVDTIVSNNLQTAPVTPIVSIQDGSNVYAIESYTYSGSANTADYTRVFPKNTVCDILVVGGGGAGGTRIAGGGGAGALIYVTNQTITTGTYTIKVGRGGIGTINSVASPAPPPYTGETGKDSEIFNNSGSVIYRAKGGGGGDINSFSASQSTTYVQGGSSGGVGPNFNNGGNNYISSGVSPVSTNVLTINGNTTTISPNNVSVYGNSGGGGCIFSGKYMSGGGGGAGSIGQTINTNVSKSGNGGSAISISITGSPVSYAGGGGAGGGRLSSTLFEPGTGGSINGIQVGGNGGYLKASTTFNSITYPAEGVGGDGLANTGSGGGGSGTDDVSQQTTSAYKGGSGGSGIVIIRYLVGTIPTNNLLTSEPTINPSVLVADAYYPRVPATNSATWTDSGYSVSVKVSDPVQYVNGSVYFLFNHIITSGDHYHSQLVYNGTGNTYSGATRFKTFAGIAISIDFGRSIYPERMRIAQRPADIYGNASSYLNGAPKAFKIFASDDASCWNNNNHSSWTQIHDQTTSLSYVAEQYTIVNFTANLPKYRYYTMVVLSTIGSYAGGYMIFSEWNIGGDEKMVFELDGGTHKKLVFDYPKQDDISEMTGMTNWVKIKHKPASWTTIYSGNTFNGSSISGTYTLNSSSDNSKEWAIPFNEPEVKYYLFVMHMSRLNPNYKDLWMVFETSEMKRASTYAGTYGYHANYPYAYKTTMKPLGFAAKNSTNYQGPGYDQLNIYNRVDAGPIGGGDPYITMYNINDDGTWTTDGVTLYAEHNLGYRLPDVEGGVYVKYDNDVPFVYPANTSYTLNFPVPTLADINNHSNIVLRGTYNINVNNSNILITPKPATFINTINNYKIERMYPPVRNFTAATTTVSGQVYGNGTYVVSYSSTYGNGLDPWTCFNTASTVGGHWAENRYTSTSGAFNSTSFIVAEYLGDWLKIQLPVAIKLTRFGFKQRSAVEGGSPKDFKIYGSNDNITWVELVNKTDAVYNASSIYEQTTPEITNTYTYYGLVVNKLFSGGTVLNFDEWYIYGQEVLPSSLSIRYNLLNPILDPIGAQWTYNSSNTNVYHMGNVGIGTKSPEYNLDVRGFIHTSVGGYTQTGSENWIIQSDRRIKENIVKASYDKCLENVKNIELYNFNFKDNCVNTNDRHQLGFIAQEVQQVYPKAVEVGKIILDNNQGINDLLTLNTTQIKYTLYGAVKNLIERVENIESRVEQIYNMTLSSNFKSPSSNISISIINTSNMTANTSNITTNTSNVSVSTSNIAVSTSNIAVSTSNISASTSNISASTSNIAASTSNIDTSNIDTSNV